MYYPLNLNIYHTLKNTQVSFSSISIIPFFSLQNRVDLCKKFLTNNLLSLSIDSTYYILPIDFFFLISERSRVPCWICSSESEYLHRICFLPFRLRGFDSNALKFTRYGVGKKETNQIQDSFLSSVLFWDLVFEWEIR